MAALKLGKETVNTCGELPPVGSMAPAFRLTGVDLSEVESVLFAGKRKLLAIVPSVDTMVCAKSAKQLDEIAQQHPQLPVLVISADLPFAQQRFCKQAGLKHIRTLSLMRSKSFAKDFGVLLVDGPLAGLTARALLLLDENDYVLHAELVADIGREPDYTAALAALNETIS